MPWATPPLERSIACHGEIVAFFRKKRGWTQDELADAAGYTKRLVAKAEASGSLSPETIEVLAETLSNDDLVVHPEDLTSSPKELATAFMRAYARYEADFVAHCRHFMSPDMVVHFPGGPDSAPLSGIYDGPDAYEEATRNFFRVFSRPDKELAEKTMVVTTNGNHAVIVFFERLANEHIPPDASGDAVVINMLFSRGKIVSIQSMFDTVVFEEVVRRWREKIPGVVDHSKRHSFPVPKNDGIQDE